MKIQNESIQNDVVQFLSNFPVIERNRKNSAEFCRTYGHLQSVSQQSLDRFRSQMQIFD